MASYMLGIYFFVAISVGLANASQSFDVFWKYGDNYEDYLIQSHTMYKLGDSLVFKYPPGEHDVIEVDEKNYNDCTVPPSAKVLTSGEDVIDIDTTGRRYFICGKKNGKHCKEGNMKLMIEVKPPMEWVYHNVGDKKGWNTGVDFQAWAGGRKFDVGDTLVFFYKEKQHNVLIVDESSYKQCKIPPGIEPHTTGHDEIKLEAPGGMWFISGIGKDCQNGMKLFINVIPNSDPKPNPPVLQVGRKLVPQG